MFKVVQSSDRGSSAKAGDAVTVRGLSHALCCLGMLARYEDTARLVSKYSASDTGTLAYTEFHKMVTEVNKFNEFRV